MPARCAPPSKSQARQLAQHIVHMVKGNQAAYGAGDAVVAGTSVALLHVLLLSIFCPLFFYWYYRHRYRQQYRSAVAEHLRRLDRRVREGRKEEDAAAGAFLQQEAVQQLLQERMEREHMKGLETHGMNDSTAKYRSLYIGIGFLIVTIVMFIIWTYSVYHVPVARVVVGAVMFALSVCLFEYLFLEFVYLRMVPLEVSDEVYQVVAREIQAGCGWADVTVEEISFVEQIREAHQQWSEEDPTRPSSGGILGTVPGR